MTKFSLPPIPGALNNSPKSSPKSSSMDHTLPELVKPRAENKNPLQNNAPTKFPPIKTPEAHANKEPVSRNDTLPEMPHQTSQTPSRRNNNATELPRLFSDRNNQESTQPAYQRNYNLNTPNLNSNQRNKNAPVSPLSRRAPVILEPLSPITTPAQTPPAKDNSPETLSPISLSPASSARSTQTLPSNNFLDSELPSEQSSRPTSSISTASTISEETSIISEENSISATSSRPSTPPTPAKPSIPTPTPPVKEPEKLFTRVAPSNLKVIKPTRSSIVEDEIPEEIVYADEVKKEMPEIPGKIAHSDENKKPILENIFSKRDEQTKIKEVTEEDYKPDVISRPSTSKASSINSSGEEKSAKSTDLNSPESAINADFNTKTKPSVKTINTDTATPPKSPKKEPVKSPRKPKAEHSLTEAIAPKSPTEKNNQVTVNLSLKYSDITTDPELLKIHAQIAPLKAYVKGETPSKLTQQLANGSIGKISKISENLQNNLGPEGRKYLAKANAEIESAKNNKTNEVGKAVYNATEWLILANNCAKHKPNNENPNITGTIKNFLEGNSSGSVQVEIKIPGVGKFNSSNQTFTIGNEVYPATRQLSAEGQKAVESFISAFENSNPKYSTELTRIYPEAERNVITNDKNKKPKASAVEHPRGFALVEQSKERGR